MERACPVLLSLAALHLHVPPRRIRTPVFQHVCALDVWRTHRADHGGRRYLIYYLLCGLGAGACQILWQLFTGENAPTVGASGAIYGILLAFGMFYPNERIMLLFPPIPMRAKYFVVAYAAIELVSAFSTTSNVAHFAHLGGMLFGWLLILYWRQADRRPRRRTSKFEGWHTADYDYNLEQRRKQERVDQLLDKVRQSGYEGLTEEEKRDLFNLTR